jgi:uncharacterized membrane protein YjjP (DUF1212 family)
MALLGASLKGSGEMDMSGMIGFLVGAMAGWVLVQPLVSTIFWHIYKEPRAVTAFPAARLPMSPRPTGPRPARPQRLPGQLAMPPLRHLFLSEPAAGRRPEPGSARERRPFPGAGGSCEHGRALSHTLSTAELADYLVEIGGMLVAYGCPSYRVEDVIRTVAAVEGRQAQAFAIPTGLFVSLAGDEGPVLRMTRVKEWGTNLARLADVDRIFNDVATHRTPIEKARRLLRDLERAPAPYPPALKWMAVTTVSAAAAVFFRGGPPEIASGAAIGLVVALFAWVASRNPAARLLVDFGGGLVAGLLAWAFGKVHPDLSREVVVLSGVIALVPGMTLTTGLAELAQKSLVAGAARLMEAFAAFLAILLGIALAVGLQARLGAPAPPSPLPQALPLPFQAVALVAAALAFAVIFAMPRSHMGAAVASGAIGYLATAFGGRYLPAHASAFGAALAICLFSNGLARLTQRPAQLFQLPGMMLLVPGSFGFLSLENFLRGDFLNGAARGFEMLLMGGALVTGVLLANVVLPAKKLL